MEIGDILLNNFVPSTSFLRKGIIIDIVGEKIITLHYDNKNDKIEKGNFDKYFVKHNDKFTVIGDDGLKDRLKQIENFKFDLESD